MQMVHGLTIHYEEWCFELLEDKVENYEKKVDSDAADKLIYKQDASNEKIGPGPKSPEKRLKLKLTQRCKEVWKAS